MIRDCTDYKDLLLDLAYGELDDEQSSLVREHAVDCADCREALESILLTRKLATSLPEEHDPGGWDQTVLELAAQTASGFALEEQGERPSEESFENVIGIVERKPNFMERMRSTLLKPALATAAAATLVFALSFFLYQNAQEPDASQIRTDSESPFYGPTGQSQGEPMLARAETADVNRNLMPSPVAAPVEMELAPDTASPASPERSVAQMPRASKGGLGTTGPSPKNSAGKLDAEDDLFAEQAKSKKSVAPGAPAPPTFSPSSVADSPTALADEELSDALTGAPAAAGEAFGSAVESDKSAVIGGDAGSYRDGMAAYNRGDCSTAVKHLQRVVDPPYDAPDLIPSSLHHLARCEKRTGRCGKALLYYENLLSRFPSYPERAEAIWEAAACHRRLGHVERASDLLDELALIPGWHARAISEKESLGKTSSDK